MFLKKIENVTNTSIDLIKKLMASGRQADENIFKSLQNQQSKIIGFLKHNQGSDDADNQHTKNKPAITFPAENLPDDSRVTIGDKKVERLEYKGRPVITLKMVETLHQRPSGTAKNTFHRHKDKFTAKEDFFMVPYSEWKEIIAVRNTDSDDKQRNPLTFLTESGYLMLVKTFGDDLAWKIQRELIDNYFKHKKNHNSDSIMYSLDLV